MGGWQGSLLKLFILFPILVGLPLVGILLKGEGLAPYLEFPPTTNAAPFTSFSWPPFVFLAICIVGIITPFVLRLLTVTTVPRQRLPHVHSFPGWGLITLGFLILAWTFAWTRFSWFQDFQAHTFTPLWICYIVLVNALTYRRTGHCLMIDRPRIFLRLFPLSAGFWWLFEYLNRFVHNWSYSGITGIDPSHYVLFMTLSFSTVLPAVFGTYEWISTFPSLNAAFQNWKKIFVPQSSLFGLALFIAGSLGLITVAIWPPILYPLLWISPLLILLALQNVFGERHLLTSLNDGDWRPVVFSALSALICGVFWELWNYHSMTRWEYAIPYVHAFPLFEMPILGYSGYLPFGMECIAIIQLALGQGSEAPLPLVPVTSYVTSSCSHSRTEHIGNEFLPWKTAKRFRT